MASGRKQDGTGHRVLRYLDEHRLDHTPEHYRFAHRVLFGRDQALRDNVDQITDGGVRITPDQVRELAPDQVGAGKAIRDMAPQLDGLTLRVLDIAGEAANATGDLNRDLITTMAAMLDPKGADVRPIITAVIDRTAGAEVRLREAVRQARQLREDLNALHDDTSRDRLTGLLNRAAMERRLAEAAAGPEGCSVAIIDVDRFGTINDQYGRAVGDRVLRAVAQTLQESCSGQTSARWDGNAFMVLFEAMNPTDATDLLETGREALTARRMKLRENDKPLGMVSFSAGVVSSRSRGPAAIVEAAAQLVRQAKDRGRNTVVTEKAAVGL
ncbi:GGDEF domain-containing protein [uncultured Sphingomonas sp.]|uniref:GGDEF domain-containing protein n=1 Tax=uncultured Sphingomonas sp. TaxID=158754 RepID=UPI0035CC8F7E